MKKYFFIALAGFCFAILIAATASDQSGKPQPAEPEKTAQAEPEKPKPTATPTPTPNPVIKYHRETFKKAFDSIQVTAICMSFKYIGDYYITAYCPEECGYNGENYPTGWVTATGTICHREEEWWNPSTCGINTSVNNYGDLFLIDGKVFIAEDTGPGAVGHWIDTFMPDYESMSNFGSHWTEVYSVTYKKTEPVNAKHFDIHDYERGKNDDRRTGPTAGEAVRDHQQARR